MYPTGNEVVRQSSEQPNYKLMSQKGGNMHTLVLYIVVSADILFVLFAAL